MALENIFGAPPEYLSGLLGVDPDKLRKQALTTGLVNTALAFAAQPRNQRFGSVLPYAARALMAGQQGAQGVYQGALQDYQTRQQIEQAKRQQAQQQAQQELLAGITDPTQRLAAQLNPTEYAKAVLQPPAKRETFVAPDGSIRFKDTGELAQETNVAAPKERKTMLAPNGMLIYADTGEPVTQRSFAPPREPKEIKLYGDTPIPTASGYVFMPTAEGMARGLQPRKIEGIESPEQAKQIQAERKQASASAATLDTASTVLDATSKAKAILRKPFVPTSGLTGALASKLKFEGRTALEGYIDTLKANLSFNKLQEMRESSPTGGALGGIAVEELRLLGSTVASLNPDMDDKVLIENLEKIEKQYNKIRIAAEKDLGILPPDNLPRGVTPEMWQVMTAEERALWK